MTRPPHPFWCDDCGEKAPFKIKGSAIPHDAECSRAGEDAAAVFDAAGEWCRTTGQSIP